MASLVISALEKLFGLSDEDGHCKIYAKAHLQRRQLLDAFDLPGIDPSDILTDLLGKQVSFRLVSQDVIDPVTGYGMVSEAAYLEDWINNDKPIDKDGCTTYCTHFTLHKSFGVPGALLVTNHNINDIRLHNVTLLLPDDTTIHFACNSWIYHYTNYDGPRIFFTNQSCLPNNTPLGIKKLRAQDLVNLRGDGTGKRHGEDRIYDYDVYNDLGDPDLGEDFKRNILGGSKEYPYPRRCRTGRNRSLSDPTAERGVLLAEIIYVPRDEIFSNLKWADFLGDSIRSFANAILPTLENIYDSTDHFDSLEEIVNLFEKGLDFRKCTKGVKTKKEKKTALELLDRIFVSSTDDATDLKFPTPPLLCHDKEAWMKDEEFTRQTLTGLNPVVIERLKEFPPVSKLDPSIYGDPKSGIRAEHIRNNLEGLSPDEALKQKRLFIVDYHDVYLPYLERINALAGKSYASRCLYFLTSEGTLKLIAIEHSLPPPYKGALSRTRVFTPPPTHALEKETYIWQLAKTHASINDTGYHQLVSHWLRSHACIEPFIIATNRQLSTLHPVHVLLKPHLKNTMTINALARKLLINCYNGQFILGGIIERTFTPGKYAIEMSSYAYKSWRFDEQSLPADLIKRGMAERDPDAPYGLKLLIKDYPFAVDGLDIWFSIVSWVHDYISIYYENDAAVVTDRELQSWWKEIREVGHGDKRDEPGWVDMTSARALEEVLVTIIWVASAHHAAVNFGQFAYAGFMPNKPTMGRQLIPEENTPEMEELERDPKRFSLKTVSTELQAIIVTATLEILSSHASEEEYLGTRSDENWTCEEEVELAFKKFGERLAKVEKDMMRRNSDLSLKNRRGPINFPYTLLHPSSREGLTHRGIPNSISI